jgi:pilus assembly protein CpaB
MRRRFVAVIGAVTLALVGTFVLVAYVNAAEDRALAGERTVDVLVVAKAIDRGTPAEDIAGKVTTKQVPAKVRAKGAVADASSLGDTVAAVDLLPGEQVVRSRFVEAADLQAVGAAGIPDGMQQVTVSLSADRAVGGKLAPGSTVGVTASFDDASVAADGSQTSGGETTHMILHKVLVTNVQVTEQTEAADQQQQVPVSDLLVTLALNAGDVEKVVFAAEHGSLWLSAEPEDAPQGGTKVLTKESIYQ